MKKKLLMALAASVLALASCNKLDPVVPAADQLAGNYNGTYSLSVMGSADEGTATFVISKVDDNTITLTTPAVGEGMMALPALTTSNLTITKSTSEGKDIFTASADKLSGTITVNGEEKAYNFTDLAIAGDGSSVSINYSLQYGRMPMAMVFKFTGNK